MYNCYIIYNDNYSYIGITNNIPRRIKQHNQILSGGAKYTKKIKNGWKYGCIIKGFKTKIHALQFEWALKHVNKKNGIVNRINNIVKLVNKRHWTKKSPCSIDYKLTIFFSELTFLNELFLNVPKYISIDF